MRQRAAICIVLAMIFGSVNIACHPKTDNGNATKNKSDGSEAPDEDEDVIILRAYKDVFLKPKGSDVWLRIVKDWTFHSGDVLRVNGSSKALVDCKNPCILGTGEYTSCCINACELVIDIQPPDGERRTFFMRKEDLPGEQARAFREQESKISSLALESTATQLLRAKLYTAWKLNEAAAEVQALDEELDKPEAKQQLGEAYAGLMLKTGDLFVKLDQKEKAAERYTKTINLPADSGTAVDRSATEKAAAHRRLAEILVETGKKAEATEQLNRAKEIYVRQGDEKKAQATDRRKLTFRQR